MELSYQVTRSAEIENMRIRISQKNLLSQVNEQSPRHNTLAREFILDGMQVDYETTPDVLIEMVPDARTIFNAIEYSILRDLLHSKGKDIPFSAFYDYVKTKDSDRSRNSWHKLVYTSVARTLVGIRKKIIKNNLPFVIKTIEKSILNPTSLRLTVIPTSSI